MGMTPEEALAYKKATLDINPPIQASLKASEALKGPYGYSNAEVYIDRYGFMKHVSQMTPQEIEGERVKTFTARALKEWQIRMCSKRLGRLRLWWMAFIYFMS